MTTRNILITSALPYANGPIHLGHILEQIQTDIWARFQKLRGHNCLYICGEDAHGTPIMLSAQRRGVTPEEEIAAVALDHQAVSADFYIGFDHYYTTHSTENKQLASMIYTRLRDRGDIEQRTIRQLYDPIKQMFLPDRFIKGECPKCHAADQYGDSCEVCGATYSPTEVINPVSVISGATPIEKESLHYFLSLNNYQDMLKQWMQQGHLQDEVKNKLQEWFTAGLKPWDISRDAPYFGFEIPDAPGKYFYVWMDAPIGYIASFKNYCSTHPEINFEDYWGKNSKTELYHFIGKDIIYFHALFWPAMLYGADLRQPTAIFAHGFLTVNGLKMSKSRGTFIKGRTYLEHLDGEYLRYYFAAKLTESIDDIDLNLDDFLLRVNADLVGKVVNIASRCAGFIHKYAQGELAAQLADARLYQYFATKGESIAQHYENRAYHRAVREIMELADLANQYIDEHKPWSLAKQEGNETTIQNICSFGLNLFRVLSIYLKPILPKLALKVETFLNISPLTWNDLNQPLLTHRINTFQPLMQRIEKEQIEAMKTAAQQETAPVATTPAHSEAAHSAVSKGIEPIKPLMNIEDFAKADLRIARIVAAEEVPEADKLLKLILDIGIEQRQVFAGIKSAYKPEELLGKLTVMVANLEPRKMRFGLSEGMVILAVGPNGSKDLWLLQPAEGAEPGMRVK